MTTQQVADLLKVHRNTIDNERVAGRLQCFRIGACVRFMPRHINEYIAHQQQRKTPSCSTNPFLNMEISNSSNAQIHPESTSRGRGRDADASNAEARAQAILRKRKLT